MIVWEEVTPYFKLFTANRRIRINLIFANKGYLLLVAFASGRK